MLKGAIVFNRVICLVLALLAPISVQGQCAGESFLDRLSPAERTALQTQARQTPFGQGLFWDATKGDTRLSLIGTLHLPDPRHEALVQEVDPLWRTADLLLVEATLQDQQDLQTYMMSDPDIMTITDGPTLPERLPASQWDAIAAAASERNIPAFIAAKMQPWFLTLSLSVPPCAMLAITTGETGLDGLLMQEAAERSVPVAPLEPWQDMFALLTAGTFEDQLAALQMSLMDAGTHAAIIVGLTDLYFAQEVAMTWHMSNYTLPYLPDMDPNVFKAQMAQMADVLLADRNANWIDVIETAATEHDHIIAAFGAAHLIGDTGVPALLERAGWTVTRQGQP